MNVDIVIEIPKNTNIKYEWDVESSRLRVDRIISGPFSYPTHYGYIPGTKAEDGDCLDAIIVSDLDFIPGCVIECKIIGVLKMEDEKGLDHKIITVPTMVKENQSFENLSEVYLKKIEYFFEHYKDLEENKWSKVIGWENADEAELIYNKSKII